jgi:hypothetical protein
MNILTLLIVQWRKTNEAVHFGKMTHYIPENVYVYFRYTDKNGYDHNEQQQRDQTS